MTDRGGYRFRKPTCFGHIAGNIATTARNIRDAAVRGSEKWAWIADDGCWMVSESERQVPEWCVRFPAHALEHAGLLERSVRFAIRDHAERVICERLSA